MDFLFQSKLNPYIKASSKNRLQFAFKTAIYFGVGHISLEIFENGLYTNWPYKLIITLAYILMVAQLKLLEKDYFSSIVLSYVMGEIFNFNLIYTAYFVYPNYEINFSQISAFILIYYQGYLCQGSLSCMFLSLKHTLLWVGTGLYFNKLQLNDIVPFLSACFWLLMLAYQATYFEYIKEQDIIRSKSKVKRANDKINTLLETLKDLVLVVSKDYKLLFKNQSADKFLNNFTLFDALSYFQFSKNYNSQKSEYFNIVEHIKHSFDLKLGSFVNFGIINKEDYFLEFEGRVIDWDGSNVLMIVGRNMSKIIQLERENRENSYKTVLINTVSHELRTPINALLSLGTLVLQSDELSVQNEEHLKVMMGSCAYQLCLINDLLDYAQIMAGCLKVSQIQFNLYGVLSECFGYIEPQLGSQINLIKIVEEVPDLIISDPNRLKQILLNLLGNARKFTFRGLITLRVFYEKPRLMFSCSDTGIGIKASKIPNLFQAFSKIEDSQEMNQQGVGLGLVISNMLVKALGGEGISVISKVGVGSTFKFDVNVTEPEVLNADIAIEDPNIRIPLMLVKSLTSKIKLLLVDDVYFNIMAYLEIFKSEGINCSYAMNGEQAIDMIKENEYSCILMDCEMPILDGWETTKRLYKLRKSGELKYLPPIIGATAYSDAESIRRCYSVGMNDVVSKPCPKDELFRKVKYWILLRNDC